MKKICIALVFALVAFALTAQTASEAMSRVEGLRCVVYSERGKAEATKLAAQADALFDLFNRVFRFDPAELDGKLVLREFAAKEGFDAYLSKLVGQTKDDYVYIHYPSFERRELLLFAKDEPERSASLAHQSFVQFLKAFVQNPPLWLRDGFAIFFETATWDETKNQIVFPENLAWLETAKALDAKRAFLPLGRLLTLQQEEARSALDVYYPEAWAFVSFLANGDPEYNRLLWDSIATLRRDGSLKDNQEAVRARLATWYGEEDAAKAFAAYLANRRTFAEEIAFGVKAYGDKDFETAATAFESAAALDAESYIPPYYLGLIAYALGDFARADFEYSEALRLGCEPAIGNYALGLSAFAQERAEDAKRYFAEATAAAPERYGAKVEELLARLNK
ncbi:MAG: hypothetical protein JNG85_07545 [Spirochaetaceae bacterium]|nr:hypothetical protein [Spirochaetaceae bacterium]